MVNFLRQLVFLTCLTVLTQQQALAQRLIYKDGATTINGNWNGFLGASSVAKITSDAPYEGGQHYRFNYDFNGGTFDGFGLQFYNSGIDCSGKTYLHLAFRGSGAGAANQVMQIRLGDGTNTTGFVNVGDLTSTTYQTVDIPISSFPNIGTVNLNAVANIQINAKLNVGSGGTGTLYFDDIELTNDPAVLLTSRVIYKDGATTINGNWNGFLGASSVAKITSDAPFEGGQHYRFNYDFNGGTFDGFGLQFFNGGIDCSGKTYLHLAFRGSGAGAANQVMQIRLGDGTNTTGFVTVGNLTSATYQTVSIPIANFPNIGTVNLNATANIQINAKLNVGSGGTGTLYFDAIELSNAPLPVELLSFKATPLSKTVQLDWKTASEKDASHFDIERSLDGKTFVAIGKTKANGTSLALNTYTFADENPSNGLSYYRLRQVDFDGTTAFSPTVSVSRNGKGKLVFAPNPAKDNITITLEGNDKQAILTLYDLFGKAVLTKKMDGNSSNLDISALSPSTYLLEVVSNGQVFREKITKF
jgi:hypothetical protein